MTRDEILKSEPPPRDCWAAKCDERDAETVGELHDADGMLVARPIATLRIVASKTAGEKVLRH